MDNHFLFSAESLEEADERVEADAEQIRTGRFL